MALKTIKFDDGTEVEADIIAKAINVIVAEVNGTFKVINVKHIVNQNLL